MPPNVKLVANRKKACTRRSSLRDEEYFGGFSTRPCKGAGYYHDIPAGCKNTRHRSGGYASRNRHPPRVVRGLKSVELKTAYLRARLGYEAVIRV